MKIDFKTAVIIALVAVIGLLAGILIGRSPSGSAPSAQTAIKKESFVPADDGKLAKAYEKDELGKVIRENAKDLQECYFKLLAKKPAINEGTMAVLLKIEEDGKISQAKVTKNELKDEDFGDCISKKLTSYYLAPPPYGINRFISYDLTFQSEETVARQAKEREEKSRPPKILPINAIDSSK